MLEMLYAVLCYNDENAVTAWTKEEDDACMARLGKVEDGMKAKGKLGPVARLLPTTSATTLRKSSRRAADHRWPVCRDQGAVPRLLPRRLRHARRSHRLRQGSGRGQSRRRRLRNPPGRRVPPQRDWLMIDNAWIAAALTAARPQALSALLRYFRNLDTAEEAFQEASLRAIRTWPDKGPPRDTVAWLIFVGRNCGVDAVRKTRRNVALPSEEQAVRPRRCRGRHGRAARWRALSRRYPAAAVRLLPSGPAGQPADRAGPAHRRRRAAASRWRGPSWSAKPPWSSASPAPRRASPPIPCRSIRPMRRRGWSGWGRWR